MTRNILAVFPEELCRRMLKYYSFEGDTVLDPFAGSGTTGRITFTAVTEPRFIHEVRCLHFGDSSGEEIEISGSSTIIIRKHEDR